MTGRTSTALIVALLAALSLTAVARADSRPLPWAGGESVTSDFEALAGTLGTQVVGRAVTYYCDGQTDWDTLASQGRFDPVDVSGYVEPPHIDTGTWQWVWPSYTHISPQACWYADRFWGATDKTTLKNCQTGTETQYHTEYVQKVVIRKVRALVWIRKTKKWVYGTKTVRKTVQEPVQVGEEVPVMGICDDYVQGTLFGIATFAHETVHLFEIPNEAVAECYGMQTLAWWAWKLGASPDFAREMAQDYWNLFYVPNRLGTSYGSYDCRDGGSLDLYPDSTSWPAGF